MKLDGSLIAYNTEILESIAFFSLDLKISNHDIKNTKLLKILNYPTMALFSILNHKKTSRNILVITVHLLFNFKNGLKKFAQLTLIMKSIIQIMLNFEISTIIWAGDFNFIPNSYLYEFITEKYFSSTANLEAFSN